MRRLLSISSLCVLVVFLSACGGPGPEEQAIRFLSTVQDGEITTAQEMMTSSYQSGMQANKAQQMLQRLHGSIRDADDVRELVTIDSVQREGETAEVYLSDAEGSGEGGLVISLIRESDGWRIDDLGEQQ